MNIHEGKGKDPNLTALSVYFQDNEIDLKLLTKSLSTEADLLEVRTHCTVFLTLIIQHGGYFYVLHPYPFFVCNKLQNSYY